LARALTAEWQRIVTADQPDAASQWRARRDVLARHGCHYWIFRSPSDPDAFLEFIEGADAETIAMARAGAGLDASTEILTELELS
jgi:hypothetical protein